MPRISLDDHAPGAPLEARTLPGGAVTLIMPIVGDPQMPAKVALVLRCEPDGRTFVAIGLVPIDQLGLS